MLITDYNNEPIHAGNIVELLEDKRIRGRVVTVNSSIIQIVSNNNLYSIYCKNCKVICKSLGK